jgi:hypothetical protein
MLLEEVPLDAAERIRRIALLTQERRILRGLAGAEPPPITVAVSRAPRVDGTRVESDASDRTVWLYGNDQGGDNYLVANLVHEWGHGVMRAAGMPSLGELRYVEDGLVDLLAHLTEQQIRRVRATNTTVGRARDLAPHSERTVDLFALGEEHHTTNIGEFVEKLCAADASFGYAVALGFWLEWMGDDPARVTALIQTIREQRPRSAKDVERMIAKLGPVGLNPRAVSVTRARAAINAAARDVRDVRDDRRNR